MKARAEQSVHERFIKMHKGDPDTIKDRQKRIDFGSVLCNHANDDFRFIFQGYDKTPVSCDRHISATFSSSES
jgi:hypothetical protein